MFIIIIIIYYIVFNFWAIFLVANWMEYLPDGKKQDYHCSTIA